MKNGLIMGALLMFACQAQSLDVQPAVQAALDWSLPTNNCIAPKVGLNAFIANDDGIVETEGKLNPGEQRKADKEKKDYDECVLTYKHNLLSEMESLKSVAQHGLNQS